jgi:hypothetical protein
VGRRGIEEKKEEDVVEKETEAATDAGVSERGKEGESRGKSSFLADLGGWNFRCRLSASRQRASLHGVRSCLADGTLVPLG